MLGQSQFLWWGDRRCERSGPCAGFRSAAVPPPCSLLVFFCSGGLSTGHSPMGVGGQRGGIPCPDMDPPWAPAPLGPSSLWHGAPPFSVSKVLSLAMSPLMHLLCCFSFVSYFFPNTLEHHVPFWLKFWRAVVVSISLRAIWRWLWLAQGNSWPPSALVTPTALWHQNRTVYTPYTSTCGLANNLNGS